MSGGVWSCARRCTLVGARLKCHRVCKVEMTPGRQGGLIQLHLSPEFCVMDAPLSAYPAPPDCLAAAGVVDRLADGSADMRPAALARTPAPRRAAYSRRSRRVSPSGSCRTRGTA